MTVQYLLDTNICIYIAKEQPVSVLKKFKTLQVGTVAMSAITFGELTYGVEKSQHPKKNKLILDTITQIIPALPLSDVAAKAYGKIRRELEKRGTPIGNNDLWIAAHALTLNLTLVTNNTKEFKRVAKLKIDNWV